MSFKIVILLLFTINSVISEDHLLCVYQNINGTYVCSLHIQYQNENYNLTNINGTHLVGFGDDDVLAVTTGFATSVVTIPSIICDKFQNVKTLSYLGMELREIRNSSFAECSKVTSIDLSSNTITEIPDGIFNSQQNLKELKLASNQIQTLKPEWFKNLKSLEKLTLSNNSIEELPSRVFSSLTNLKEIFLDSNKLQVIHSESFWILPNLEVMNFVGNQIEAIDERILDVTGVNMLLMVGNNCSSGILRDNSTGRVDMRSLFKDCFDKYEELFLGKF